MCIYVYIYIYSSFHCLFHYPLHNPNLTLNPEPKPPDEASSAEWGRTFDAAAGVAEFHLGAQGFKVYGPVFSSGSLLGLRPETMKYGP